MKRTLKMPTSRFLLIFLDERHNFDCVWYYIWVHQVRCMKQATQRGVLKVIFPSPNTTKYTFFAHGTLYSSQHVLQNEVAWFFSFFFKSPDWLKTWCKDGWQHGRPPTKILDKMQAAAEEGVSILSHKRQLTKCLSDTISLIISMLLSIKVDLQKKLI